MPTWPLVLLRSLALFPILVWPAATCIATDLHDGQDIAGHIGLKRGICVLLGNSHDTLPLELVHGNELTVYTQFVDENQVARVRKLANDAGLLGVRVYVEKGDPSHIHLADNLADVVIVLSGDTATGGNTIFRDELLRVLRPGGKALVDKTEFVKPFPVGADEWSHPYHGPDNNPSSTDKIARAPYLTQFLAEPWYGPMPQVTTVSGGRIFKAFGHKAAKTREWPLLNTLLAINGYNGTILWKRELHQGFMIHRNTMVATPDVLYLADDVSCKLIDAATGKVKDEIVPPEEMAAGKAWKWLAFDGGVLYAMLGAREQKPTVQRGRRTDPGWKYSSLGGNYPWGFGNTLLAVDPATKKVLWYHQETEPLDSRATCMSHGRLFSYSHGKFLFCLDVKTGKMLWKTNDAKLLAAIGPHHPAQTPSRGIASTTYTKCNDKALYFAGPQRRKLVAISAEDGRLLYQYADGNVQLVLRDDGLYAIGRTSTSKKLDLLTGKILADLACFRGNCTRATASIDSIFSRGYRHTGTQRIVLQDNTRARLSQMRPGCQDGVLVAGGLLYWGPYLCDCNHSLIGLISLGPAGDFDFSLQATELERLEQARDIDIVASFDLSASDWPTYRADSGRRSGTRAAVSKSVKLLWQYVPVSPRDTTAPVVAGGLVFVGGSDGVVRAFEAATGQARWSAFTGGAIVYPPALWQGRVYVGSADSWVYAFEAVSGRLLWRFRAAPVERKIPLYGRLSSTWPVASGVLLEDGVVYAAAGIASYDGTHVYALDAVTGRIRWQNNTSGRLVDKDLVTGVSVQGHLLLHNSRLYLAAGNFVSPAIYDIKDGACLNKVNDEWEKIPHTRKWQKAPRGRELFLIDDRVVAVGKMLYGPKTYHIFGKGDPEAHDAYRNQSFCQASTPDVLVRARNGRVGKSGRIVRIASQSASVIKSKGLWENRSFRRVDALTVTRNAVLAVGRLQANQGKQSENFALAALNVDNGKRIWTEPLPAAPASWGMAVDRDGRIIVALEDGRLVCFSSK